MVLTVDNVCGVGVEVADVDSINSGGLIVVLE